MRVRTLCTLLCTSLAATWLSGCAIVPAPVHRHHGPVVVHPAPPPVIVQPGYGYGRGHGHGHGRGHHHGHRGHGYY